MLGDIMIGYSVSLFVVIVFSLLLILHDITKRRIITWKSLMIIIIISVIVALRGYVSLVLSNHYSVDSFNRVYDLGPYWELQLGRYLNGGLILIAEKLAINPVLDQQGLCILWMFSLVLSITLISVALIDAMSVRGIWKSICVTLGVSIAFVNVFMMELMLFPEVFIHCAFGMVALALAIYFVCAEKRTWLRWLFAAFFLVAALGNYQSYIGIFVSFALVGVFFRYRHNAKRCFGEGAAVIVLGGISSISNIVLVKKLVSCGLIADAGRGATLSINDILSNVASLLSYQKTFWLNADGLQPVGIMPVIGIVFVVASLYIMKKIAVWQKVFYVFMVIGCYALGYAAHIIESPIIMTPRSNIAVFSAIVIPFIVILGMQRQFSERFERLIVFCILLLLFTNTIYMNDMARNEQVANAVDFVETEQICEQIREYELESGNVITCIGVTYDESPTIYHNTSRYRNNQLGARILATSYSGYRLISYQLGRGSLILTETPSDIYGTYFGGRNWDCLDVDEQLVFDGDTMYMCIY